jgi:hypothetical protein
MSLKVIGCVVVCAGSAAARVIIDAATISLFMKLLSARPHMLPPREWETISEAEKERVKGED